MKKIQKYNVIALFSMALAFGACSDDFLDEQNPNTITSASFWQTQNDFELGLVATYGALQYTNVAGGNMSQFENVRSDVGRSFDFYGFAYLFDRLEWNSSTGYVNSRWEELYIGVNRANQVINKITETEPTDDFTAEEQDLILAQARFLRAAFYFWIANSYGGGVLRMEVPSTADQIEAPFVERQEIIDQIVKPDLHFAMAHLPRVWTGVENTGRATWGAATSLLGKVHLYDVRPGSSAGTQSYDSAAYYLWEVIDSNIYGLTADIGDNFTDNNEFNQESIFEVSYNDNFNIGVSAFSKEDIGTTQGAEANNKAKSAAPQLKGGWRVNVPTHWVNELYESDEIDPALAMNDGNNYSMRAYWSIAFLRQDEGPLDGQYYQKDGGGDIRQLADWFNGGAESCYWKKGTNWYKVAAESPLSRSGINERLIRLADVYLMYAEAVLSGGQNRDENFGTALEAGVHCVDLVRSRAGVRTIADYASVSNRIPQLHRRGTSMGSYPQTTLTEASLLTHIQMVERVLELSFEGMAIRWNDLVRWGMVEEAFENQDDHVYLTLDAASGDMVSNGYLEFCGVSCPEIEKLADAIERYSSAAVMLGVYDPAQHDYFPVPLSEANTNNGL